MTMDSFSTALSSAAPACAHDVAVAQAARAGTPPDTAVLTHMAGCASCRETYETAAWMNRFAAEAAEEAADRPLPDAARIWWRARLLQRWEAETRATAPLDVMQRVEVIGSLILAAILLVTMWPELRDFQVETSAAGGWWPTLTGLLAPTGLTTVVLTAVLLLGLMAVFTVHQLLQED